jgi:hypothetical protein
MNNTALVITSIAEDSHPVLAEYARECAAKNVSFIVIGDTKSPAKFELSGCDFFSIAHQNSLDYSLARSLPTKHYARKNIGYLIAFSQGSEVIIETDDDNIPLPEFWRTRERNHSARIAKETGWTNVYRFFSNAPIWPRGFALDQINASAPELSVAENVSCPVQQGLADDNPDVDAIYRLTLPLPIRFNQFDNVGLQQNSICPFNSQNTTWFEEAFPLLYLPSYCSFRMTDIWRSFVAQRVMWASDWTLLFHNSTVRQERNDHSLMADFEDEISGYLNNHKIMDALVGLNLKQGSDALTDNLFVCYEKLVASGFLDSAELRLLSAWIKDIDAIKVAKHRARS